MWRVVDDPFPTAPLTTIATSMPTAPAADCAVSLTTLLQATPADSPPEVNGVAEAAAADTRQACAVEDGPLSVDVPSNVAEEQATAAPSNATTDASLSQVVSCAQPAYVAVVENTADPSALDVVTSHDPPIASVDSPSYYCSSSAWAGPDQHPNVDNSAYSQLDADANDYGGWAETHAWNNLSCDDGGNFGSPLQSADPYLPHEPYGCHESFVEDCTQVSAGENAFSGYAEPLAYRRGEDDDEPTSTYCPSQYAAHCEPYAAVHLSFSAPESDNDDCTAAHAPALYVQDVQFGQDFSSNQFADSSYPIAPTLDVTDALESDTDDGHQLDTHGPEAGVVHTAQETLLAAQDALLAEEERKREEARIQAARDALQAKEAEEERKREEARIQAARDALQAKEAEEEQKKREEARIQAARA